MDESQRCDQPGCENPASVNFTQIVNDEATTLHLCESCAAEKGLQTKPPEVNVALTDFLAQLGDTEEAQPVDLDRECEFCGLTLAKFRESGLLGCSHCYVSFESHLKGLLRRVHGGTQHVGKIYQRCVQENCPLKKSIHVDGSGRQNLVGFRYLV